MKKYLSRSLPFLTLSIITILVFWQFFFKGFIPFPGEFMLVWYEPWKGDYSQDGVITLPHKPIADDIFRQLYPFKILAMDMLKQNELPLWNPYNGAGQPLLATMHVGLLNPLNILFFLTNDKVAWSLQVILPVLGVGLSTYLYAKKIGLKSQGSLFAAASFMLSGFVIIRSIYNDYNYAVICFPLLLYLIEDYITNQSKKILLLPLIIFFLITVVQPQIILYVLGFALLYLLIRLKTGKEKPIKRSNLLLILLFCIGFLLGSIQLLPTYELYQQANITTESSRFIIERFLLPLQHFITIFIPNYFGNQATYNYWGSGDYIETIVTTGAITFFLALFGLVSKNKIPRSFKIFSIIALILTLLLTLSSPLTNFVYSLPIPLLSTGIPSRMLFILSFCISMLAGFGIEAWLEEKKLTKRTTTLVIMFSMLILFTLFITSALFINKFPCENQIVKDCWSIALRNTFFETAVYFTFVFFFMIAYVNKIIITKSKYFVLILFILIAVGFYNSQKFLPFSKPENIMPSHKLISELQNESSISRMFGYEQYAVKTDFSTHYRFMDASYYDPLYIKRYGELVIYAKEGNLPSILPRSDVELPTNLVLTQDKELRRQRLLDLLGVNTIIKTADNNSWTIKKNDNERVLLIGKTETVLDKEKILERTYSPQFDPKQTVVLEKNINLNNTINGSAMITSYKENYLNIESITDKPAVLLLSDNYYPGWKAYIDEKETEILRANYTFRAILVPAGKHHVRFDYVPDSLRFGMFMSLTGIIIYLSVIIFWPKVSGDKNKR